MDNLNLSFAVHGLYFKYTNIFFKKHIFFNSFSSIQMQVLETGTFATSVQNGYVEKEINKPHATNHRAERFVVVS